VTKQTKKCIIGIGHLSVRAGRDSLVNLREILPSDFSIHTTRPMRTNLLLKDRKIGLFYILAATAIDAAAQASTVNPKAPAATSDNFVWYLLIAILVAGLVGALYLRRKKKDGTGESQYSYENRYNSRNSRSGYDSDGLDAEKEMEWFRKAKKPKAKSSKLTFQPKKQAKSRAQEPVEEESNDVDVSFDSKVFQDKMRKLQYSQLPINSFLDLRPAGKFQPLPLSNDESLIAAIEQVNEEYEEDETVRDLAVRILMAFKTRNSIEALSQVALYDLSANLRSKAVTALTEFDHESVFEAILLACADPTREVRAAAARGLFRLNFDRADAWKRIIETGDEFQMSQAARAAIESGIVTQSLERLIHAEPKIANEAFALVSLLIKSGETDCIFDAIANHKDERVKFALLHVLKVRSDERSLAELKKLKAASKFTPEVSDRVNDTIYSLEKVSA